MQMYANEGTLAEHLHGVTIALPLAGRPPRNRAPKAARWLSVSGLCACQQDAGR